MSVRALDPSGRPAAEATLLRHEGGGPHPERQCGPHALMCHDTPDGLLYVADLPGLVVRSAIGWDYHPLVMVHDWRCGRRGR